MIAVDAFAHLAILSGREAQADDGILTDMTGTSSTSDVVAYFGYGSLVNELTWLQSERRPLERHPVEVQNWSREWAHCADTPHGPVCVLTAVARAGSRIQGVLIRCDAADLAQIDTLRVYVNVPEAYAPKFSPNTRRWRFSMLRIPASTRLLSQSNVARRERRLIKRLRGVL